MRLNLTQPVLHGTKRLHIIYRVCHDNPHCTLVISLCYGLESLLTSCVPDLHSDFLSINFYSLDFEIDSFDKLLSTYGGKMRCHKVVLAESK